MSQLTENVPLSASSLMPFLSTNQFGNRLSIHQEVSSTNTVALELAQAGTPHGTAVLAEHQTAGRGRLGRTWHSTSGKNLYCSLVTTKTLVETHVSWIPLLAGVALAESLITIARVHVSLKWPNDIMIQDKKLAGVLCERTKAQHGGCLIVGIGVNLNSDSEDFPPELLSTATSVKIETSRLVDRHQFIATFLKHFEYHYQQLLDSNLQAIRGEYVSRCSTLGREVRVQLAHGDVLAGLALAIGDEGDLQVTPSNDQTDTVFSIRSGDVVHVR